MSLADQWRERVQAGLAEAVALRREIHANPRLSGDESDTAQLVCAALGFDSGTTVATTGRLIEVPGWAGPAVGPIALRAELDSLPIVEQTNVPWAATNGAMHACGHDVHLSAVVAVAKAAAGLVLPAPLTVLLQPREETGDSGARDVVREGHTDKLAAVIAAHVQPQLDAHTIAVTAGAVNAGVNQFTITITGREGHSGYPQTVIDPVLALAAVVVATQQIAARRMDPTVGCAVMVTQLNAGSATNVVPGSATARGTMRFMSADDERNMQAALSEIVNHTAAAYGAHGTISFDHGEPALLNDAALASDSAERLTSAGYQVDTEWRSFGSDDFAFYCGSVPSLMIFIGTGPCGGGLHASDYLPPDEAIVRAADALIFGYLAAADGGAAARKL